MKGSSNWSLAGAGPGCARRHSPSVRQNVASADEIGVCGPGLRDNNCGAVSWAEGTDPPDPMFGPPANRFRRFVDGWRWAGVSTPLRGPTRVPFALSLKAPGFGPRFALTFWQTLQSMAFNRPPLSPECEVDGGRYSLQKPSRRWVCNGPPNYGPGPVSWQLPGQRALTDGACLACGSCSRGRGLAERGRA